MLIIINYILISIGTLVALLLTTVLFDVSSLSGMGGGMALVVISKVFKPLILLSVLLIVSLAICAYFTDISINPHRFWVTVTIPFIILFLGIGIFLSL